MQCDLGQSILRVMVFGARRRAEVEEFLCTGVMGFVELVVYGIFGCQGAWCFFGLEKTGFGFQDEWFIGVAFIVSRIPGFDAHDRNTGFASCG